MTPRRRQRRSPLLPRLLTWLGLSVVVHVILFGVLVPLWPYLKTVEPNGRAVPVTLIIETPEDTAEVDDPEEQRPDGQIVDVAPPEEEQRPEDAEYLAEHDITVEEEMRTEKYRINPEVLSNMYSTEDKLEFEDLMDLDVTEPSTGAEIGNDRFDPDRNGTQAALPSKFKLSNKEGLQKPVPSSHRSQALAGAPNNDLVDEVKGDRLALNTQEILYASYLNRIRRLVNFYWNQNLDNLPGSVRSQLSRPEYVTELFVVLDGNGALDAVEVTRSAGIPELDHALIDAFRIAGPFPNPPEQLVAKDGRVYLPRFGFTLQVGQAQVMFKGVDPRQDVRYPGILKAPY